MRFAVIGAEHPHVLSQVRGLVGAGAELVAISAAPSNPVSARLAAEHPGVPLVDRESLLARKDIGLVLTAGIPDERGAAAVEAMWAGKHVVTDKPGCTSLDQLAEIDRTTAETGRFWSVTFSGRFGSPGVIRAGELVRAGRIGQVVQVLGLGPHRIVGGSTEERPDWFWDNRRQGGILTDIACHQIDQFLWLTDADTAEVVTSVVANHGHPGLPDFQDFGELMLRTATAHGYIRVDWFTPRGLPTWGDGRLLVLGTEGYLELRRPIDGAGQANGSQLFVADAAGTEYVDCVDQGLTYWSDIVNDVRDNSRTANPQHRTLEAMRLAILAQDRAERRGAAR